MSTESLLEELGYHRPEWQKDAGCKEAPTVNFHPGKGKPVEPALRVCGVCLCRTDCLEWALADPTLLGVLGGMTAQARINTRKLQQRRSKP